MRHTRSFAQIQVWLSFYWRAPWAVPLVLVGLFVAVLLCSIQAGTLSVAAQEVTPGSEETCVACHRESTPGIVEQYRRSTMAAAGVGCRACHEVKADYPEAVAHQGTFVLQSPTSAKCETCHPEQVKQFNASRHGLPAYVAYAGSKDLSPNLLAIYQAIPEGTYAPDKSRHVLGQMEGPEVTRFACEGCHSIGQPRADGSVGRCQKCHLRHEFGREQVRKPETCNACHIGPDHPQWEIYQESPHGVAYMTRGYTWNWNAVPDQITVKDLPAATCAMCHISGFGGVPGTHDVGERLSWFLFAPISERRPGWEANVARMKSICAQCHSKSLVDDFYLAADKVVSAVNVWVKQSDDIMKPLKDRGLLTEAPFDEPIDFTYFELWHHWGRTAKFGAWMQGPDYTQWHGAYEVLSALAELRTMAEEKAKK